MENRYFIVSIPNPNMSQIYDIVIQSESTIRKSLDGTKGLVKLPIGDIQNYGILQNATEYTHSEILVILNSPEWAEPI